ncbi:MAG: AMIN domain-containing protein [Solidesulfovibrio sp.]
MPLTRGDKLIIIGAVALAVTVVLGLAVLKKPYLFTGGKPQAVDIPPAPTTAPAVELPVVAPPPVAAPVAAAPAAVTPATPAASAQAGAPRSPAPAGSPATGPKAGPPPAVPAAGSKPAPLPTVSGDDTLEKMFAEIASDAASGAKTSEPKATAPAAPTGGDVSGPVPTGEPQAAVAPSSEAAPAPAPVEAAPEPKPELKGKALAKAKAEAKAAEKASAKAAAAEKAAAKAAADAEAKAKAKGEPKPAAPTKPEGKPEAKPEAALAKPVVSAGNVVRIIAEEKPGEYVLIIQTDKSPASFQKMFMVDPPRMVLDVAGSWSYNGPLSSATGNDFIRHIRIGKHPDKFRVVLDMSPDAPGKLRGTPTLERVPEGVALKIPK